MDIASVHAGAQTTDLKPEMGHEGSKEEDAVELSKKERPVTKRRILMLEKRVTQTRSATKPVVDGTSTFSLEDNPMDSIICDLEGVRSRIAEYELQMQQVGELVGYPPRKSLVAAIQDAIQDPRWLRELERKMDHLTVEKQKTAERVWKLEAERQKLLKQVNDTTFTVQNVSDVVDIPGNVWWKAKMFDAELKNAGHISGSKMVIFIIGGLRGSDSRTRWTRGFSATWTCSIIGQSGSPQGGKNEQEKSQAKEAEGYGVVFS